MGKIRRGNYVFIRWIGDHGNHMHVYKNDRLVLKWDLDKNEPIGDFHANRRLLKIISTLQQEGKL